MLGVFMACGILLWLDGAKQFRLEDLGSWVRPFTFVLLVVSGALSITGIGGLIADHFVGKRKHVVLVERRLLRKKEIDDKRAAEEAAALGRIRYLSPKELRQLTDCLRTEQQSFYTYGQHPWVGTLITKGLVAPSAGSFDVTRVPFTIFDFAWKALLEMKEELLKKDNENRMLED
jgi:hypothetical protein